MGEMTKENPSNNNGKVNVRHKGVTFLSIIGFLIGIPMLLIGFSYCLQFGVMLWIDVVYSLWLAFGVLVFFGGGCGLIRASWGLLKLEKDKGRLLYISAIFSFPILYIIWYITGNIFIAPYLVPLTFVIIATVIFLIITMCFAFIARKYLNKREIRNRFG